MGATIGTVAAVADLLTALLANSQNISNLIAQATAAGRTTLTPEEWATITGADDSAEAALKAALAKVKVPV